uniref:DNA-directed RNA polymerase n=1 Tax=viral metagenome TaxID=1070528 RepID=A0A6C0BJR1_9ZZZZ
MPSGLVRPSSEIEPIVGIQFGIFSPDEIEKRSVVEITNSGTYDGAEPRINGLFDPRMGVLDNGKTCRSCGQSNHNCPGHFGHFRLARPVYYIQFFQYILNVLSCVCVRCSKLLIDKDLHKNLIKRRGEIRWRQMLDLCSGIGRCGQETEDGCGARQPDRYIREGIARIIAEWDKIEGPSAASETKQRQTLEVEYVLRLFRRITDEDVDFMGLSRFWCRPDWMICTVLAVPPPQVRPSVIQDNNQRSEDDLTHKLFDIINMNNMLQEKINNNAAKNIIDEYTNVVQYHVATLVDNQIPGVAPSAQRSGRPLKSIQQRLGSKEGRIRYNIQGKRVEFSARSVITPDPNLSVAEIGVPMKIAMNLTVPERVTPYNREQMYKLIQNGADKFPGAKTLIRQDGRMISLRHVVAKDIVLYLGDTINRHLMDGDIILFNRQPTLHRMSMMGHRVKVLPFNTFRLNVSVTSPYNADFDGDEMNAHIPQSLEASTELAEIAAVPHQIVTPRHAKPVIGIVQDTLVGSWRMTRPKIQFNRREFMNMMMWNTRFEGVMPQPAKGTHWSGQQVISQLLPPINMEMGNGFFKEAKTEEEKKDNFVIIREGEIIQGILDKDIFSKPSKGVVHTTFKDYGSKDTVRFIDSMQNTVEQFLVYNGFSVGISDLIADEKTRKEMDKVIKQRKSEIENILLQVHLGLFTNTTGKTNQQEFEDKVYTELNKATELSGKIGLASLADENRLIAMVRAGSKGSTINIAQMMACVGQQAPEGRRIPYGFTDRTLPHYKKYDDGAEARGFVESSFIHGLTPQEFFFHAMSGREGLIDTAVKSVTGDTKIVIVENGQTKCLAIGEWIDAHLASNPTEIEHFVERNMELLQLKTPASIPTVDADGRVSWSPLVAVTRHDPGDRLYKVTTLAGKNVTVTEAQSLLVWDSATKQFEKKSLPEVKLGDFVPVTAKLSTPPSLTRAIALSDYLPKTEYLYGTDFICATALMNKAMEGRSHIPAGWWEENNGITFTLPYDSKARLQRCLVRSKVDTITHGYVYPFTTNREHTYIPELFELNKSNGIFLGLFLAEGNVDIKSGYVQITNNNEKIREFVVEWFDDRGISSHEDVKLNHIGGVSSSVRGFSTVLAQFLTSLVGHGASNKRVPAEAFTAPEEFIVGLLNGYFSGDGTVSDRSIDASSASEDLIDGISMLCSRLGIFGKVSHTQSASNNLGTEDIKPTHRLAIRAQWAARFVEKVDMIDEAKAEKLRILSASQSHRNFASQNDVVLDEITEIEVLDASSHPKVYDLTVPSTFNFGLANGLHVRDTADTGYIQRQLVKAMEDLVIQFDGTVRDARNNIVQFHYGEDGVNSTKIETQGLGLMKMTETDILTQYAMRGVEGIAVTPEDQSALDEFAKTVLVDRGILVEGVYRNKADGSTFASVNLERLLLTIQSKFGKEETSDLTPSYILEGINKIISRTQSYHILWGSMLRFYLAPHKLILKEKMSQLAFDALVESVVLKNWQAWAQPGEHVGIIAAQSIGEPSTQMSCVYETIVAVTRPNGENYFGPVGAFIDGLLPTRVAEESSILDLSGYKIASVSKDEKVSWAPISQISRHPANGGLVKVVTKSGRTTTATLSHSFLKRSAKGIVPVLGSDLKLGMRIPIAKTIPVVPNTITKVTQGKTEFTLTKEFGWLCGIYLADGSLNGNTVRICKIHPIVETRLMAISAAYGWVFSTKDYQGEFGPSKDNNIHSKDLKDFLEIHFKSGSYVKELSGAVFSYPLEFKQGLLSGYFDGDGNVNVVRQQIRVGSRSEKLIRDINRLFGFAGFFTVLGSEASVRIPGKTMWTLNVLKNNARAFKEQIGLSLPEKAAALEQIIEYMERDEKHDTKELYDKIPELGELIAETGRLLKMPGQSRSYGRWLKKDSVGRQTLQNYLSDFNEMFALIKNTLTSDVYTTVKANLDSLCSAANSDVVWDEIVDLIYLDDPKTFVYDFTVPGNESFMVDDCIMVHNTLNTFHLAGVAAKSNVTRGVPRLKELLKVTKSPKAISLTVYLKPEFRESKEKAREVAQDLELTMLKDVAKRVAIYYDPKDEDTILPEDKDIIAFHKQFEVSQAQGEEEAPLSNWLLRMELDREKLFNKNISMDDISFILKQRFSDEVTLIYSDFNSPRLIMRMRLPRTSTYELDDLANLKKFIVRLLNGIVIRGTAGIKGVSFRQDKDALELEGGAYKPVKQYVLDTDGSNFQSVMIHPMVDGSRLVSSHVHDIYENLGIEATRTVLLNEISTLFEEAGVNYRHLGLLCDVMTNAGRLMSVDRYGINKKDIGPLAKASFEETEKILLRAAIFGETDPVTGVSANIMTGQVIRGGTAFSQILLDEAALLRLQEGLPPVPVDEEEDVEEPTEEEIADELHEDANDMCSSARLRMNIVMPNSAVLVEEPDVDFTVMKSDD